MAHCDEKNAKNPQQCQAIKDDPKIDDIYKGGNILDRDHPGYAGEDYGHDFTNEVGKEKLSAKGSLNKIFFNKTVIISQKFQ